MKQFVFSVLCLFAGINIAFAQAKPEISVDKAIHDFGKVNEEAGNISCEFVIKNTGNAPLVISRVTASCGCTTPDWTKSPIAPGATGTVKATYGAKGRPGPFSKTISVYTNAQDGAYMLTIKGDVIPKTQSPEEAYPVAMGSLRLKKSSSVFNMVKNTETRTDVIEVYNGGSSPLKMSFSDAPQYIAVTATPASIEPGKTGTVTLTYDGKKTKAFGSFTDKIKVNVHSAAGNNSNFILVTSSVTEDFSKMTAEEIANAPVISVEPASLTFNNLSKEKTAELKVTNNGKSALIIHNIQSSSEDMLSVPSGKKEIKPGKSYTFKATVHPAKVTKNISVYINIASNDPKAPVKAVRAIISLPK